MTSVAFSFAQLTGRNMTPVMAAALEGLVGDAGCALCHAMNQGVRCLHPGHRP